MRASIDSEQMEKQHEIVNKVRLRSSRPGSGRIVMVVRCSRLRNGNPSSGFHID
jgi:hypothetical protein